MTSPFPFHSSHPLDQSTRSSPSAGSSRDADAETAERFGNVPHPSEGFRSLPHDAESFRSVLNASESFGNFPQDSEVFRNVPHASERFRNDPNFTHASETEGANSKASAETREEVQPRAAHETLQHRAQPPQSSATQSRGESFGNASAQDVTTPRHSESLFRKAPSSSAESFRDEVRPSERFRTDNIVHGASARTENHTLTIKEVARMFEAAGVARTERSVTNWCQPNRTGVARLDGYFDPNERRYFITPQSAHAAIEEEKAKASKNDVNPTGASTAETYHDDESFGSMPKQGVHQNGEGESRKEDVRKTNAASEEHESRVKELEREVIDLRIANRGKDQFIELLTKERDEFGKERQGYVQQLIGISRKVGELSSRLLQLGGREQPNRIAQSNGTTGSSQEDIES